jgi:alpha-galactosidase
MGLGKIVVSLVASALVFACVQLAPASPPGNAAQEPYTSEVTLTIKRCPVDFGVDGDLSKASWKLAESVEFDHDAFGQLHHPELSTRVASVWTETYIYFAFWARYDSLHFYEGEDPVKERWRLWERDVVEVFVNPQPERVQHYFEFEVAPNNQWVDLEIDRSKDSSNKESWDSHFEHATRVDAKSHLWTTEMRTPLAAVNVTTIHAGDKWRANFFRAAGQGGDEHRQFLAWSTIPEGRTFHVPTRFGILEFVDK